MPGKKQLSLGSCLCGEQLPWVGGIAFEKIMRSVADRRTARRFRVKERLLAVCDSYAGEIYDFSRSGFSFRIVHVRKEEKKTGRRVKPSPSRTVDIFSPGGCLHLFRDLDIEVVSDRYTGPLYTDNGRILQFRRGVRFAVDLTDDQMKNLLPYLSSELENGIGETTGDSSRMVSIDN